MNRDAVKGIVETYLAALRSNEMEFDKAGRILVMRAFHDFAAHDDLPDLWEAQA